MTPKPSSDTFRPFLPRIRVFIRCSFCQNRSPTSSSAFAYKARAFGIERIGSNPAPEPLSVADLGDVAILAVAAANSVGRRDGRRPHRGRGALRDGLPPERRQAGRGVGRVDRGDQRFVIFSAIVALQLGLHRARMDSCRADIAIAIPPVEFHREEHACRLRAGIGRPWVIGGLPEVRVV
jgi:hypothetical protein